LKWMIHWSRYNHAREQLSRRLMAEFALRLQFAFSGVPTQRHCHQSTRQ
jgi:hypothetical protein